MIWFFIILLGVMVALHMARPRFERRVVSGARFFLHLPRVRENRSRLRWGRPPVSLLFFLRVSVMALFLGALVIGAFRFSGGEEVRPGVWLLVDTSAGMTVKQEGGTRMEAARKAAGDVLDEIRDARRGRRVCFNLSAFDMERRDLVTAGDIHAVQRALAQLKPRPLGTDLSGLRRLVKRLAQQGDMAPAGAGKNSCPITHVAVISETPAPDWVLEVDFPRIIWKDISRKVSNTGFTALRAVRNPLTGSVAEVAVEITRFGSPVGKVNLEITRPRESPVLQAPLQAAGETILKAVFRPSEPGLYRLRLSPGGAYAYDDTATIRVEEATVIPVDWRLPDRAWLSRLGWKHEPENALLRITSGFDSEPGPPVLVVGGGYGTAGKHRDGGKEIRDFVEDSPLLADVSLDVAESLGIRGLPADDFPAGFTPLLRGMDGGVWLASCEEPLAAYVPGLPTGGEDAAGRFSATVFFNALRWLLKTRPLPPLYTLTAPHEPEPSENRIVLHPGEGNTWREPRSVGEVGNLESGGTARSDAPQWPLLLAAALVVFLIERLLSTASNTPRRQRQ